MGGKKLRPPAVTVLEENMRTHQRILSVANVCIKIIRQMFPKDIDVLKEERAQVDPAAPWPILVDQNYGVSGIVHLFGSSASQCIIVRNEAAKKQLVEHDKFMGIIYTIAESKGLEAKDVVSSMEGIAFFLY